MANLDQFSNIFICTLARSLPLGGADTEIYLSSIKTLDGQAMQTTDFSLLGRGVLTIDCLSAPRIEFASFTGVSAVDTAVTGCVRGLSFKNDAVIPGNAKFHPVGTPVLIAFGTHNLRDLERLIETNSGSTTIVDINSGSSGSTAVTSLTFPLTTSGINPGIVVQVNTTNVPTIVSVTYDGVSLTQEAIINTGSLQTAQYFLTGASMPVAGTYNVVVTISTAAVITAGGETLQNVNQANPIGAIAASNGSSTTPDVSITTLTTGSLVIDSIATGTLPIAYAPNAGQDLNWVQNTSPDLVQGASSATSVGSPATIAPGYTLAPSTAWVMTAIEIRASGSDQLVKVNASDSTAGYLQQKLTLSSVDETVTIIESVTNPGGDEVLNFDLHAAGGGSGGGSISQVFRKADFTNISSDMVATFTQSLPPSAIPLGVTYNISIAFDSGLTMEVEEVQGGNLIGALVDIDSIALLAGEAVGGDAQVSGFDFTTNPNPVVVIPGVSSLTIDGEITVTVVYGLGGSALKFGGDGSDGALAISSGTTTIDCAGAALVVKNYTSISITGTGALAFSNPNANGTVVELKSQGEVTLTSSAAPMIDCSGLGAAGGAGGANAALPAGQFVGGVAGTAGVSYGVMKTNFGVQASAQHSPGAGGAVGVLSTLGWSTGLVEFIGKYPQIFVGAGGAGGSGFNEIDSGAPTGDVAGGHGGNGGGCLIIECAGAINFTTSGGISVAGANGTNGTASGGGALNGCEASGGSGGGGGSAFIFYNILTAFSGTITITGGSGGTGQATHGSGVSSGGGGGSATNAGTNGSGDNSGVAGGAGLSVHAINTEYA